MYDNSVARYRYVPISVWAGTPAEAPDLTPILLSTLALDASCPSVCPCCGLCGGWLCDGSLSWYRVHSDLLVPLHELPHSVGEGPRYTSHLPNTFMVL